eukprot:364973-Chlamydomonas_euryale.AAC.6
MPAVRTTQSPHNAQARAINKASCPHCPHCPHCARACAHAHRWLYEECDEVARAVDEGNACFGTVDSWIIYMLTGGAHGWREGAQVGGETCTRWAQVGGEMCTRWAQVKGEMCTRWVQVKGEMCTRWVQVKGEMCTRRAQVGGEMCTRWAQVEGEMCTRWAQVKGDMCIAERAEGLRQVGWGTTAWPAWTIFC